MIQSASTYCGFEGPHTRVSTPRNRQLILLTGHLVAKSKERGVF
jgi:hypothetical protein